jgi:hypothetical protein
MNTTLLVATMAFALVAMTALPTASACATDPPTYVCSKQFDDDKAAAQAWAEEGAALALSVIGHAVPAPGAIEEALSDGISL